MVGSKVQENELGDSMQKKILTIRNREYRLKVRIGIGGNALRVLASMVFESVQPRDPRLMPSRRLFGSAELIPDVDGGTLVASNGKTNIERKTRRPSTRQREGLVGHPERGAGHSGELQERVGDVQTGGSGLQWKMGVGARDSHKSKEWRQQWRTQQSHRDKDGNPIVGKMNGKKEMLSQKSVLIILYEMQSKGSYSWPRTDSRDQVEEGIVHRDPDIAAQELVGVHVDRPIVSIAERTHQPALVSVDVHDVPLASHASSVTIDCTSTDSGYGDLSPLVPSCHAIAAQLFDEVRVHVSDGKTVQKQDGPEDRFSASGPEDRFSLFGSSTLRGDRGAQREDPLSDVVVQPLGGSARDYRIEGQRLVALPDVDRQHSGSPRCHLPIRLSKTVGTG
ncbi:hypothetical protein BDK51DRAFT_31419 [Blyttiomyces helicus]|uniref:Uncharacterized protein n=1 Tax=Blyttiomyces helicus TaxID=388810 RepID=A0A4P9WFI0_9FUNG|nr:hypothetical protein BDK51DRAFT_31419 [Blyttiomyces helicus]|eukprot:RKO90615.1 hypothetical protein BDK51DRAFT_31419 [Blyttiomyces helicus]